MKQQIESRFDQNLRRVENLIKTYVSTRGPGRGRRDVSRNDILRAAVVFLHATLEDLVRSLEQWKLPAANDTILNAVPLAGSEGRPEKFLLGRLAGHRGKTVDELINESVREYLAQSNYGNVEEVARTLTRIGLDVAKVKPHFPRLSEMMARRHNIVHRADENPASGSGQHRAKAISPTGIQPWIDAVRGFGKDLLTLV